MTKFKYLSTHLDAKFSLSSPIHHIKSKIRLKFNVFKWIVTNQMTSIEVRYRLYKTFIKSYPQSLLNIYSIRSIRKERQLERLNYFSHRRVNRWYYGRNIAIRKSTKNMLTNTNWNKLTGTILNTNPEIIQDFLKNKLALVYLPKYLRDPALVKDRS